MNPLIELTLVLAMFAALVALSYAMHGWRERHPVVEVVTEPAHADEPQADPFASAVMLSPAFYNEPGEAEEED